MATLLKCGGLFLHVPKTGGNWVSDVLQSQDLVFAHLGGKHAGLRQLEPFERLLQTPRRYDRTNRPLFTFCFVRHPLRWYESWYRMNLGLGWPQWDSDDDAWNPSVDLNNLGAPTFNGFIENVLGTHPGFLSKMYGYYAEGAHYIGRQERMSLDLIEILAFLNVRVDSQRVLETHPVNVSARVDVSLDAHLQRALEDAETAAYARFGYDVHGIATRSVPASPLHAANSLVPLTMPIAHDSGFCWRVAVPMYSRFADDEQHPIRSMLWVFEDGQPLAQSHAIHAQIRQTGSGQFSHWKDTLFFSASDNSNPNVNGRRYAVAWTYTASPNSTTLLFDPAAGNRSEREQSPLRDCVWEAVR